MPGGALGQLVCRHFILLQAGSMALIYLNFSITSLTRKRKIRRGHNILDVFVSMLQNVLPFLRKEDLHVIEVTNFHTYGFSTLAFSSRIDMSTTNNLVIVVEKAKVIAIKCSSTTAVSWMM